MDTQSAENAARLLWQTMEAGSSIQSLPRELVPENEAEGHMIQDGWMACCGQEMAGWIIAATSMAGQKHINVNGPLAGRLLSGRVLADGADISLGGNAMRVMEAEFAFRFGKSITPRDDAFSVEEVLHLVSEMPLTIKAPDSRFSDYTVVGKPQLVADNACAWLLVEGPAIRQQWREVDLRKHAVRVYRNGEVAAEGIGANVLGNPKEALTWLVNDVGSRGETIGAGELVTTGTCIVPAPISPGDRFVADFGVFGQVKAEFS